MGRYLTRELIQMTLVLVLVFLVLTHATGAARVIGAGAKGYGGVVRALQGRR